MQEQIDRIKNITDYRERFFTRVFIESSYYSLSLKLLYIDNISLEDDWLYVTMTDSRLLEFKVLPDTHIYSKNIKRKNIAKDINSWNIYDGKNR